MNEKDGPRLPTLPEMKAQLEQPLNPDLLYFDATPSIEQLAEMCRQLADRMVMLEKLMQLQGDINGKLMTNLNQMIFEQQAEKKSSLILPDRLNS